MTDAGTGTGSEQGAGQGAQQAGQAQQGAAPAADPWANPEDARAAITALRQENASWRTKVRDLEPLAAKATAAEEAQKTETQKLTEKLAAAEAAAQAAQGTALRFQVAAAKGLPPELAGRLQGATEAELNADADALAALVNTGVQQPGQQGGRPPVDLRQGARGTAPVQGELDKNAWLRDLARQGGSGRLPSR